MSSRVDNLTTSRPTNRTAAAVSLGYALRRILSRRWLLATVLVLFGVAVNIRLGIWQLDRLEQRRAFNARVQAQLDQPLLVLDGTTAPENLAGMEYRAVFVRGEYDHTHQVYLRNQAWENQIGVHLLTPLKIEGSPQVVLVDRGWVPVEDFTYNQDFSIYDEPGVVEVRGMIRASQDRPDFGRRADPTPAPGSEPLKAWYFANVAAIAQQLPSDQVLPVYVQQAPAEGWESLPHRTQPKLELTEGPHLGYAIQWFTFAAVLGLGYPFFIRKQESSRLRDRTGSPEIRKQVGP